METKDPFEHYVPSAAARLALEATREAFRTLHAQLLLLPVNRERSLAITSLEQAAMWANKAIVHAPGGAADD